MVPVKTKTRYTATNRRCHPYKATGTSTFRDLPDVQIQREKFAVDRMLLPRSGPPGDTLLQDLQTGVEDRVKHVGR